MRRSIMTLASAVVLAALAPVGASAQADIPEEMRARTLPRQKLAGPRFGFTAFTGDVAKLRQDAGKQPLMSQFGWQFETRIVSTRSGNQALMEWVVLVGGVEQDELNVSLGWLAGYRLPSGVEFGVGPNLSFSKDATDNPTTSMLLAAGATLPFGELYVPANLAVALAEGGPRITALLGWIVG